MQARLTRAGELLDRVTSVDRAALTDAFAAAARAQETAARVRLLVSLACLLAVIGVSLWISRGVLRSLGDLTAGFRRFGEGDFATPIPLASRDELADVAQQANQMAISLDRTAWLRGGQTGIAEAVRGELEPVAIAQRALSFLARYVEAPAGAIYYLGEGDAFELLGRHALAGVDATPSFRPGEGMVGQAAL